jgi:hypothetical protein
MVLPMGVAQSGSEQYLTLPTEIPTFMSVFAAPNPIGVGQLAYVSTIFSKPLPTNHGLLGDMHEGITIEITAPNGKKTVLGPADGGMIGGWATTFTPDQVGDYKIQSFYPGQTLKGTNPYNNDPSTQDYHLELRGSKMLPTNSTVYTLTVQEDPVSGPYQTPALPTEYWNRPINSLNWAWGAEIGSNWLGLAATGFCTTGQYDASGNYQPYGTAPNSAHILWSKPIREGGQPGGPIPADPSTQFTSTSVVINMFDGTIVMNGISYYTVHASWTGDVIGWEAVNLKTGETLWSKPAGITGSETLKCGQIFRFHNAQEFGSIAYLFTTPDSKGVTRVYDAWTGVWQANITGSRNLSLISDDNPDNQQIGALLGWFIQDGNLERWNSTKLFTSTTRLQDRTKVTGTYNWSDGIDQIIPLPQDNNLNKTLSIGRVTKDVILLRYSPSFYYQGTNFGWQVTMGYDAITGEKLWGPLNQTLPLLEDTSVISARDGKYILLNKDTMQISAYSLETGQKEWGPVQMLSNANSWLDVYSDIAYDKVYMWDTGGIVQAYDLQTGKLAWNWTRGPSGYDDPRGIYELFGYQTHSIADGKLFLQEGFMYTPPVHPARRTVLNCTTGELVWDILSYSARAGSIIADGCLQEWDSYTCELYTFGKGPTQTTVSITNDVITHGNSVLIKGNIIDTSAGSKQEGIIENFPQGLPAVSDASMTQWMEYVYKQQTKPTNTTGVPVTINVVDANGNYRTIGTTTSDATGFYSLQYTPDISGKFTVYAVFGGTDSYYSSQATTAFTVEEPAPVATPQPTQAPTAADLYFIPAIAGLFVAIIAVGLLTVLMLKKRP